MRRAFLLCAAVVLVSATVSVGIAQAATCKKTLPVNDPGDSGVPGQLRRAITDVCDGGKIMLRAGLVIGLQQGELVIPSGKTITILNPSQGRSSSTAAIIDAQGESRVMFVAEGANLTLERLTIQGGVTDYGGGGIYNAGTLNLEDSTIAGNNGGADWPVGAGGGIFNSHDTGQVNLFGTSLVSENIGLLGAGIFNGGEVNLYDDARVVGIFNYSHEFGVVTLHGRSNVDGIGGYYGGKVYLFDTSSISGNGGGVNCCWSGSGSVELEMHDDSSISGNGGAGISAFSAVVTLYDRSSISGNGGAGISAFSAVVTLNATSSISGNMGGGILIFSDGLTTLNDDSSITGNTAGGDGGGVYNGSGTVILNDTSSITGNTAGGNGGGVYNLFGSVTVNDDSFISGNNPDDCYLC